MVRLGSSVQIRPEAFSHPVTLRVSGIFLSGGFIVAKSKKGAVEKIALQCSECNRKNYTTTKNRRNIQGKMEFRKYCKWDRKVTVHKEAKIK